MADIVKTDMQAGLGARVLGTGIFGQGSPRPYLISRDADVPPDTIQHAGYRNGAFRSRAFRVAADLKIPVRGPERGDVEIRFLTARGALLGVETTAIRRPIISEVDAVSRPNGGGRNARIILSRLPDFAFRNTMVIEIKIAGEDVFRGQARYSGAEGTTEDQIVIEVESGLSQLERVREDLTVPGPVDLGRAFRDLFLAVQDQTSILYSESLINTDTGVTSAGDIELNKSGWRDVFDKLALGAGHQWGINARGYIYFLPLDKRVQQTYLVGHQINDFHPELNFDSTINSLLIKRAVGKGEGGSGWVIAATGKNQTSIDNHGIHHREIELPGRFDDELADSMLETVLAENADPKWAASLKDLEVKTRDDLVLARGPIRVISAPTTFRDLVQDCERIEDFTLLNLSGNSAIELVAEPRFSGAASLKYSSSGGAEGDIVYFKITPPRAGFFESAIWHVFSPFLIGDLLEFGAGWTTWAEEQSASKIAFLADWFEAPMNLPATRIGEMGFRVLTNAAFDIYLDAIELKTAGHRTYDLELDEVRFRASPGDGVRMDLKLGPQPGGMFERIAALADLAESTNAMGERRE